MMVALLIIHGLLAVALLGAITHQAIGVLAARAVTERIGPLWAWLIPSLVMIDFAYLLRSFSCDKNFETCQLETGML